MTAEHEMIKRFTQSLRYSIELYCKCTVKTYVVHDTLYIELNTGTTMWRTQQHEIYSLIRLGLTSDMVCEKVVKEYTKYIHKKFFW